MPTYDYHCTACGHQWEQTQSIKADPEHVCPKCHKHKAQRGVGMGAAILVGGHSKEPPAAAAKASEAAKPVVDTKAAATPGADAAKKPASTASGATPPAPAKPAEAAEPEHKSNATHPAREGRGVGNMRDALARARRQQEQKFAARNVPRGGAGKSFSAPKRPPPSRGGGKKG